MRDSECKILLKALEDSLQEPLTFQQSILVTTCYSGFLLTCYKLQFCKFSNHFPFCSHLFTPFIYLPKPFTDVRDGIIYLRKSFTDVRDGIIYLRKSFPDVRDDVIYLRKSFPDVRDDVIYLPNSFRDVRERPSEVRY